MSRHLPQGWRMPPTWRYDRMGSCGSCHAIVAWCLTDSGPAACDRDGRRHRETCPDVATRRRAHV